MPTQHQTLSKKDILHLAKLANLQVSEDEIAKYESQLDETIAYVDNLKELKTEGTTATAQTTTLTNVFFTDGTANTRGLTPDQATANSQKQKDGYFKVTKIM